MGVTKRFCVFWVAGWLLFCTVPSGRAAGARATLPVKLYGGYTVVVQGSIADIPNLNFIIDTGALPTVVDARIAGKLGLSGNRQSLTVFSRQVGTERVVLPNVRIGPVRATGVQGLVADLSFAEKSLGLRIDAIVGLDVLAVKASASITAPGKSSLAPVTPQTGWPASRSDSRESSSNFKSTRGQCACSSTRERDIPFSSDGKIPSHCATMPAPLEPPSEPLLGP